MKNMTRTIATVGLAALLSQSGVAQESKDKPILHSPFVNATLSSRYLGSRGFIASEGFVMQSDVGFNLGNVTYDFWANTDLERGKVTEVDNGLAMPFKLGDYSFNATALHFNSPLNEWKDSFEIGLSVSKSFSWGTLNAFAGHIFANQAPSGEVYSLGIGKELKLADRISLNLDGKIWYNNHYWANDSNFSHTAAKASLKIDAGKKVTVEPFVTAQKALNDFEGTFKDILVYGISVTKTW